MRVILIIFFVLGLFYQCSKPNSNQNEVLIQFLTEQFDNKKDYRMYVPLPPPDMHDSTYYEGKMKPDSVIRNLKPLTVYINDSIRYDSAFKPKMDFPVGFSFVKEISTSLTPAVYIDINSILRSKEVIIRSIQSSEIENILSTVRYRDNYGGIISFQNLLFSKDQKKAYFEVHYFKGKLNASTYVVYAEWRNGKWKYQLKQLSIS